MARSLANKETPPAQAVHHERRNADNSAAFVLPKIERMARNNPNLKILDVGAGSGSITASFARLVPQGHVVGIDKNPGILPRARAVAEELPNIEFREGDGHNIPFGDATFDVAFCHQVLIWTPQQWEVLAEMLRVTKPGGIVAAREGDFETDTVWPPLPVLRGKYHDMVANAMKASGGSNMAGRELLSWAMKAGAKRSQIQLTYGTWCYQEPEERKTWSQGLVNICRAGRIREIALESGSVSENDLEEMIRAWEMWADSEDASIAMLHGEIVIQK